MTYAPSLSAVHQSIPRLLAAAYWFIRRSQFEEAVVSGWAAIEQLIDDWWRSDILDVAAAARRERLADSRTYGAAARLELLVRAGAIEDALAEQLHAARGARNDVAHRLKLRYDAIDNLLAAMGQAVAYHHSRQAT